jgi:nitrogenase molybdenum-iron protein NifN
MADVVVTAKPLAVSPLKAGQPIGASLAFLGLARAMPLEHGARGCTSFNKLFFMRHYNEPIALQTTAMDQVTTVLGADREVVDALDTICRKDRPHIIGLITTGLSELQGADMGKTLHAFRAAHPEHAGVAVVPVSASDTLGCLETGFAAAVEAIVTELVPARDPARAPAREGERRRGLVNVLASAMLTPADLDELRAWIDSFGLTPILVPDIGDSLDGHMIDRGFSTLTYGGTPRAALERMPDAIATLVIGRSLSRAADLLRAKTGVPDVRFDGLTGLAACDAFTEALAQISGAPVPPGVVRRRARLEDAMVDCQFQLGGARAAIAADADQLATLTRFFASVGVEVVAAVASSRAPILAELPVQTVVVGDLDDLECLVREERAELVVTNSHGVEVARRSGAALLRAGFPIYDAFTANAEPWVGYAGTRRVLFRVADLLGEHYQEIRPYRSCYRQSEPCLPERGPSC